MRSTQLFGLIALVSLLALGPSRAQDDPAPEKEAAAGEKAAPGGEHGKRKPNRLVNEKSPYLLQHAYNPVDWYPWGEEAFRAAREQNKPIFLSIGYSTCHWCHVMERESFEDEDIAEKLNSEYIAIKVDREERPDVDEVYMAAVIATQGRGGWPLSAFLTPDGRPFFLGTYFPPRDHPRRGLGFLSILGRISEAWRDERAKIDEVARNIASFLERDVGPKAGEERWTPALLDAGYEAITEGYDPEFGGFGGAPRYAPKFPRTSNHDFLMAFHQRAGKRLALEIVTNTLSKMADGGIYDHLGKGFHRYSVDRKWLVPHFEKMLYDNSLVPRTYIDAYRLTGNERFLEVATECLGYLLARMYSPEGAFYSAEDADSEGEEGKYYVFNLQELEATLGKEDATLFAARFGVTEDGNFEDTGKSVLHIRESIEALAKKHSKTPDEIRASLEASRVKLLAARGKRIPPLKDDKVLTDWNAMAISAMAHAFQATGETRYLDAATRALGFIREKLVRDGELLHRFREGEARYPAYFEDHAFLTTALIDLYEATLDLEHLREASKLSKTMLAKFWDAERGGFFHTGPDHEKLIVRTKEFYDGAVPSGNSVAARALVRLAAYTGEPELTRAVDTMAKLGANLLAEGPSRYPNMLLAAATALAPRVDVVIVSPPSDPKLAKLLAAAHRRYFVSLRIVRVTRAELGKISDTLPFLKQLDGELETEVYGLARRGDGGFARFEHAAELRAIVEPDS